jgi:recombination protein RecA
MARALTAALTKLQKSYKDSIKDPDEAGVIKRIFLSSPQLNFLFGGGWARGRIFQLHGPESSGKSTLSTYIAGEIQKQAEHKVVIYVDFERTFDVNFARRLGLKSDPDHFIFLRPENGEEGFTMLEELIRSNEIGLIIWDSDATTPSRSQMADEYGKASFGGSAKVFSDGLRKFNPLLDKFGASMIIISQERASMSSYGADFKPTGGYAIKFYATNRSRVTRIDTIKEKGVEVGINIKVKNGKNKAGVPFREAFLTLMFDTGFDVDKEYIDFLVSLGIVEQAGAWFNNAEYGIHLKGREALQEWLTSHPKEYTEIKLKVNEALTGATVLDANNTEDPEDPPDEPYEEPPEITVDSEET